MENVFCGFHQRIKKKTFQFPQKIEFSDNSSKWWALQG